MASESTRLSGSKSQEIFSSEVFVWDGKVPSPSPARDPTPNLRADTARPTLRVALRKASPPARPARPLRLMSFSVAPPGERGVFTNGLRFMRKLDISQGCQDIPPEGRPSELYFGPRCMPGQLSLKSVEHFSALKRMTERVA